MKRFSKRTTMIAFGALLVALAALTVGLLTARSEDGGGPAWVEQNIDEYRATLAVSTNPTEQAFLQDKLQRMEQIQSNRLQALQNAPTKPADPCALRPTPEPTVARARLDGISAANQAPINPEEFTPTSQWQGRWAEEWVTVFAGFRADDPPQGVVWVLVDNAPDFGSYESPKRGGALRITGVDGFVLTLQDETGAELFFDVASRVYLDSPDETLPTLIPKPTFTPDAGICPAALPGSYP